jgi:hypothetical protein
LIFVVNLFYVELHCSWQLEHYIALLIARQIKTRIATLFWLPILDPEWKSDVKATVPTRSCAIKACSEFCNEHEIEQAYCLFC